MWTLTILKVNLGGLENRPIQAGYEMSLFLFSFLFVPPSKSLFFRKTVVNLFVFLYIPRFSSFCLIISLSYSLLPLQLVTFSNLFHSLPQSSSLFLFSSLPSLLFLSVPLSSYPFMFPPISSSLSLPSYSSLFLSLCLSLPLYSSIFNSLSLSSSPFLLLAISYSLFLSLTFSSPSSSVFL